MNSIVPVFLKRLALWCFALSLAASPAVAFGNNTIADFDPADVAPEAHGAQLGGFTLFPSAELVAGLSDNVFATDTDEIDDTFMSLKGTAVLSSNWSQHMLLLGLSGSARRFAEQDGLDRNSMAVDGRFIIDVRRSTQISLRARYSQLNELPGDTDLPTDAAEESSRSTLMGFVGLRQQFAQFRVDLSGSITENDYDDVELTGGGTFDNDVRDHRRTAVAARVSVPIGGSTDTFIQASWNARDYDQVPPAVAVNRNSEGYEAVAGFSFAMADRLTGEVFAGYMSQEYETLSDISGAAYGAELAWKLTPLTRVDIYAERDVRETASIASPGYLHSAIGADINHELLRTLNLRFGAQYSSNDFEGIVRNEDILATSTGAAWRAMPNLTFELAHDWVKRETDLADGDYTRNQVTLSMRGAF